MVGEILTFGLVNLEVTVVGDLNDLLGLFFFLVCIFPKHACFHYCNSCKINNYIF